MLKTEINGIKLGIIITKIKAENLPGELHKKDG